MASSNLETDLANVAEVEDKEIEPNIYSVGASNGVKMAQSHGVEIAKQTTG